MARLILVEDEFIIAKDIQSRLRGTGHDIVSIVATGADAIARAGELRPDVVLMDIVLKGEMDGVEAAQQIIERFDIPIIFLTAHTDATTVKRATATASYGFLFKPFDVLELSGAIEMAISMHGVEEKAHESDRYIRELTESLPEMIFETDMSGNITFINRAGLEGFGYTKEQVEGGVTLYDLVSPDKHEEIRESIAQATTDESSAWIEFPGVRRDGSTFPTSGRASLIVREGVPVGMRGIVLNVTEQKRTEQKLRESERRIREITDALPVVVYEADATGSVTFANTTAFDMFGYTKDDLEAGMNVFQLIAPADKKRARAMFRRRMRGEDVGRMEYTGLRKDGSTFPLSTRIVLMRRDGAIVGMRGTAVDITERTQAEERTKEHTHTIEILNRIMTEGNRASDVQSFAEAATKLACELMHFDIGGLYLIDADARYATLRYAQGLPEAEQGAVERIPCQDAPFDAILIDGEPLFAEDYVTFLPQHAPLGIASLASVPLYSQDKIIGVLNVGSATPHTFSEAEKDLLVAIGNEVGTVIAKLQVDEAFKEGERRLRELTDALPEIIFETDANGIVTFANATPFTQYGYTIGEIEGKMNLLDFVAPFDRKRARENISKRIQGEDVGWEEYTLIKKDGSTAPCDVREMPIFRNGVYEGLRGIGIDITERKRTEAALIGSERRIRELTDALPIVVYEADETGHITFANETAFEMFGYTKEELVAGITVFQLITPVDRERGGTAYRRRTSGDDIGPKEYTGLRKDGSTFPVTNLGAPIRRDGAAIGVRGAVVDITEQKQAEERVREHTHTIEILNRIMTEGNQASDVRSFAETVTNLTLELLHFDAGTIHLTEARCAKMRYVTGFPNTAVEAIRELPFDEPPYSSVIVEPKPLFVDGHKASSLPHVAELGLKSLAILPLCRYDQIIGALSVGSFKRHTFSQSEKDLLTAIGDEAGAIIAKLQADELIKASLKEWETLLKEIHHRVKNNMQIVSSLLSLQAAKATEQETIEILDESQRRIRSMALIHEKLYRSESLAEIDFGDYVESFVEELLRMYNVPLGAITITADIENVQFDVDTAIPCALIINELVSNSLKYAFPDGRTGTVTIALQRANGAYTLTVADDGVGFPADLDFRTTDSLGMQLVVTLVNQLEGTIELNRENGTAFVILFHAD